MKAGTNNADVMEMYAAPEARGNVLEPAGAVNIKFRKEHLVDCANRLDPMLADLNAKHENAKGEEEKRATRAAIDARLAKLLPIYHQIALYFGDLHDTPRRMLAKNVIRDVIPWRESRRFFYYRLQRKLLEAKLVDDLREAIVGKSPECTRLDKTPGHAAAMRELATLISNSGANKEVQDSITGSADRSVLAWLRSPEGVEVIQARVKQLRSKRVARSVAELGLEDPRAMLMGLMGVLGKLGEQGRSTERDNIVNTLRRGAFMLGKRARPATASSQHSSDDNLF